LNECHVQPSIAHKFIAAKSEGIKNGLTDLRINKDNIKADRLDREC
jgi:hypothetical protein